MVRIVAPFVFIVVPLVEIVVFILVGREIGVLPTILIALGTSALGVVLVRRQGLGALRQLRDDMRARRVPAASIGRAIVVALAGVLLILPGFVTDVIGLLLFIPVVRGAMWRLIAGSVTVHRGDGRTVFSRPRSERDRVIDLEATPVPPERRTDDGSYRRG